MRALNISAGPRGVGRLRLRHALFLLVGLIVAAGPALAQRPYLVRDIGQDAPGSDPHRFVGLAGATVFVASRVDVGEELWVSDSTVGGTALLADIFPGPRGSDISELTAAAGQAYFFARDQAHGNKLWRSNGTAAGTVLVADLNPGGEEAHTTSNIVEMGGFVWFLAMTDGPAWLYRSDGTAGGTRAVAQTCQSACYPTKLVAAGNLLFFGGENPATGVEPWISDGSSAGTHLLLDINPGSNSSVLNSSFSDLVAFAGGVAFTADDGLHGVEVWVSDGTAAGTVLPFDIGPSSAGYVPYEGIGVLAGRLYFEALDATGYALWTSDGTASGTARVTELNGIETAYPTEFEAYGGLLYFRFYTGSEQRLWRTDGTPAGTLDLGVVTRWVPDGDHFHDYATAGGALLFPGPDGLYRTDGSPSGTTLLQAVPANAIWRLGQFGAAGAARVLFAAPLGATIGNELWSTDGAAGGAQPVAALNAGVTGSSDPQQPFVHGDQVCFLARTSSSTAPGLWCSDGSAAGTRELPMPCDVPDGCLSELRSTPQGVYLQRRADPDTGKEPWMVDPATGLTEPLGDFCPGPCESDIRALVPDNPRTLLGGSGGATFRLWSTEGNATSTIPVAALPGAIKGDACALNGIAYFIVESPAPVSSALWRSDGTDPGTFAVFPLGFYMYEAHFVPYRDRVLFTVMPSSGSQQLWKSGGSTPTTELLLDPCPKPGCTAEISVPVVIGDWLYYYVGTTAGRQLYRSDGTAAGTQAIGPLGSALSGRMESVPPVSVNGLVFFVVYHGLAPELWQSDGTPAGTAVVSGAPSVLLPNEHPALVAAGGRVWFFAWDDAHGVELWSTDGTAGGTTMTEEIVPGPDSAIPVTINPWLVATPERILFPAADPMTGIEPWAIDLPAGINLLRNDDLREIRPPAPPLATLLPLDPVRDRYVRYFPPSDVDPDAVVVGDASRPLVFYATDGPGLIQLVKTSTGRVRIYR